MPASCQRSRNRSSLTHTDTHSHAHRQVNYSFSFMAFVDGGSGCQCKEIKTLGTQETSVLPPAAEQGGGRVAQQVYATSVTPAAFNRTSSAAPSCQVSVFGSFSLWKHLCYLCISSKLLFLFRCLWKTQSKRKINVSSSNKKVNSFHTIYIQRGVMQRFSARPGCNLWNRSIFSTFIYSPFIISQTVA